MYFCAVEGLRYFFFVESPYNRESVKWMKECNIGRAHYESLQWIYENVMQERIV